MDAESLVERRCLPCEGGVKPLSTVEAEPLLNQLASHWSIESAKDHQQLVKRFGFPDFKSAVDFVNRITEVAEAEGHHPDLLVQWGSVRVQLWTHAAGGLTENDFILAAKLDRLG
ncbi:MAG: 4a-hydroxytetrahydrobiopterin dehydratase [Candidatus Dormibacteraceae bacterium]